MKLSAPQADRLTRAVEAAESKTSMEVVVTLLPRVTTSLGVAALAGAATAFLALVLILFLEDVEVEPDLVVPVVGLIGALVFALVGLLPARWVSRSKTRAKAVDDAAHAAFSRYGVYRTTGRTGLLVLVSLSEGEARLLADIGVLSAVPLDVRQQWQSGLEQVARRFEVEGLARELEALGERAGDFLPRLAGDVDELPNAPHVEAAP